MWLIHLLFVFSNLAFSQNHTFYSVSKQSPAQAEGWLVHETDDYLVYANLPGFYEPYNYYLILTPPQSGLQSWLNRNASVVHQQEGSFAIIQVDSEPTLWTISEQAHHLGGYCGLVQKISPMGVELVKNRAPQPLPYDSELMAHLLSEPKTNHLMEHIQSMQSWQSRFHSSSQGVHAGERLLAMYQELVPQERSDISLQLIEHKGSPQKSVRVRIEGQESDEIVILGSHLDSINRSNQDNAPGADDNASGTATNLEIFRSLMVQNIFPRKTIEIHAYAAEEIGLVGSQEMAEEYKRQAKPVVAMLQMDMNGYTRTHPQIHFVSNGTNTELNRHLSDLARRHLDIPVHHSLLMFGSSDHASWHRQGYAVSFPTENPRAFNRSIHTDQDTVEQINSPEQIRAFTQLGLAYLLSLAGHTN
jgi:bacterial leucyl aminopeptidase